MCGVFATTRADLWRTKRDAVLASLGSRGPDASGWYCDDAAGVILGHTRLAVVGLDSRWNQPFVADNSALSFNGEVFNYKDVAQSLCVADDGCDTPMVHALLARRGPLALGQLEGMFALAFWDSESQELIVAKDPFGIKPLYELQHPDGGVTYASNMSTLMLMTRRPDPLGVAHYLTFGHTTTNATALECVSKVPPGCFIRLHRSRNRWRRAAGTYANCCSGTGESIPDAVRTATTAQLMSDVPVAVFLSAGTDSTLLAAIARPGLQSLHAYTAAFPDYPAGDESGVAARNAARLDLEHVVVPITNADLARTVSAVVDAFGEPIGDPAALPVYLLSERAQQDAKVVLTGEGSDELFGGYARHRAMKRLPSRHAPVAQSWMPRAWARVRGDRPWQRATEACLRGGGPLAYVAMQQAELDIFRACPDVHQSLMRQLFSDWESARSQSSTSSLPLRFDRSRWLPNTYLEKLDRATMAHGIEGRVPFLTHEVAAAAERARTVGKSALAAELRRIVPDIEAPDRKRGLAIDVGAVVTSTLRDHVVNVVTPGTLVTSMFGPVVAESIAERAKRSALFAYRLGMAMVWADRSGADV